MNLTADSNAQMAEGLPLAFERDRIDGTLALPLWPDNVSVRGDEAMLEVLLSADHDIEVHFPAPGGEVEAAWLERAADILAHLAAIDNEVQRVSAEQWAASRNDGTYPSSYFDGDLAYITLTDAGAVLTYFVIGCNSEWDERFVRTPGGWKRVADTEPIAAPEPGRE